MFQISADPTIVQASGLDCIITDQIIKAQAGRLRHLGLFGFMKFIITNRPLDTIVWKLGRSNKKRHEAKPTISFSSRYSDFYLYGLLLIHK